MNSGMQNQYGNTPSTQAQGAAQGPGQGAGLQNNQNQGEGYQVYVGDLDPSLTNPVLMQTFREHYPSCFEAKIICDPVTR